MMSYCYGEQPPPRGELPSVWGLHPATELVRRWSNDTTGACLWLSLAMISRLVASGRLKNDLLASQCCEMVLAGMPWLTTAAEIVQHQTV